MWDKKKIGIYGRYATYNYKLLNNSNKYLFICEFISLYVGLNFYRFLHINCDHFRSGITDCGVNMCVILLKA